MDVSNKKKENAYSHFLRNKAMITYSQYEDIQQCRMDGLSKRETARKTGLSRRTIQVYWELDSSDLKPITRHRNKFIDNHQELVEYLYRRHRNRDVARQELGKQGFKVPSLRTIQRATSALRKQLRTEQVAKAYRRVESYPGDLMQIDYGTAALTIC